MSEKDVGPQDSRIPPSSTLPLVVSGNNSKRKKTTVNRRTFRLARSFAGNHWRIDCRVLRVEMIRASVAGPAAVQISFAQQSIGHEKVQEVPLAEMRRSGMRVQ